MIQREDVDDKTVVHFAGRKLVDMSEVNSIFESISKIIDERERPKIVLNLDKVEYLSSFVLGKLLVTKQRMETVGGRMALCHVSPHIGMIFQSPSKPLFEIYDDEQAALQSF